MFSRVIEVREDDNEQGCREQRLERGDRREDERATRSVEKERRGEEQWEESGECDHVPTREVASCDLSATSPVTRTNLVFRSYLQVGETGW